MKTNAVQKWLVMVVGCVVFAMGAVEAQAGTTYWDLPNSGNFETPGMWTAGVPVAGDRARFNEAGTYTVTITNNVANGLTDFEAGSATTVTLDIAAGKTWTQTGNVLLQNDNHLIVLNGTIDNSADMQVGQQANASASLSLSNATVNCKALKIGQQSDTTAAVLVEHGSTLAVGTAGFFIGSTTAAGSPTMLVSNATWAVNGRPYFGHGTVTLATNATVSFDDALRGLNFDVALADVVMNVLPGAQLTATKVNMLTTGTQTLAIAGGTVDVAGQWKLDGANSKTEVSGGTVTVPNDSIYLQNGEFSISGGSVTTKYFSVTTGGGHLTISGGVVEHTSTIIDLGSYGTVTVIGTNATITVQDDFMARNNASGVSTNTFLFSHGGVSPIQIAQRLWAKRDTTSVLTLGLNGYMAAITTNAMTLYDSSVTKNDDFTDKTDLSIFEAGRQIGDTDDLTYEARLLAAEKVSEGPLSSGSTTTLSSPQNAGWIDIDNTGMSGTVDIHVLLDYAGASKNQAQLIADMTAAGLTVSETTQGPDTYITIATPAPAWSNPAFAWDLSGFDANVKVDAIRAGGFSALGTVISIQ